MRREMTSPEGTQQHPVNVGYIPTEEERRVFKECNDESFWYRSLPFSAISMLLTQGLVSRVAGFFGYITGKISYMKTCQEKFKNLENSAFGEALRQNRSLPSRSPARKSEFADTEGVQQFPAATPAAQAPDSSMYASEYRSEDNSNYEPVPFSASLSESSPTGISDHAALEPTPFLEEAPKRKPVTYDELRSKNRDTYEVAATQRGEAPARPAQERPPRTKGKVNKYGDEWEE
ncbi:OCIA domain-containing protein 1 isoform X2 [Pleurodeles waltl]|uniref:OCIA domain-containing protein 1 isoform X2 n=1 Tax=Pleurodeles waltl TaxID=8319 RepID=UPI003709B0C7